jgi:hypothetical protein
VNIENLNAVTTNQSRQQVLTSKTLRAVGKDYRKYRLTGLTRDERENSGSRRACRQFNITTSMPAQLSNILTSLVSA